MTRLVSIRGLIQIVPLGEMSSQSVYAFRLEPISEVLCVQWTLTVTSKCHLYLRLVCTSVLEKEGIHVELVPFRKIRKKKKLCSIKTEKKKQKENQ